MPIEQLRRNRAEINAKVQALAEVEAKEGDLNEEQLKSFNALTTDFEKITQQIQRLEGAERMAAASAMPVNALGALGNSAAASAAVHIKKEAKQYVGAKAARMVMSIAAGKGDLGLATKFARDELNDADVAMAIETSAGSGGAIVPTNIADEVVELLRAKTVVRRLGAQVMPLPNGNLSLPRISGGATSGYVGEGADVLATESAFDDVQLSAKTQITLVPMSNQLVGRAGYSVEQMVLNDMLNAKSVREDKAFLRDDGTSNTPTGFKKTAETASRTVAWSGTANLATIDAFLDALILMLMNANSMMVRPGWALSPTSYMKLFGLRDGNGNKVYPEMNEGVLKGYPFASTTTIPNNIGAGANESEIYFADWNDVVIGESESMSVDFSREATYKDAAGNLVSAFARNQSLIRLVAEHDVGFRHPEGLVLGTGIIW
ncbi:phage major capsid protein (plasmid) [Marinobacter sp. M3C]|jgi:HK97 family phage major capsid protein|uniref:phage major capsid protein n=1 Tax=Marinobacter sp. M3C TaxID=2917715 RepID=UPI00200F7F20|nr:phage major capsid protein [Marinobacter sp. M3C]MCL1485198.1 phage major capsid protein [Marinobacter sp.]UQG62778.1 phage major capsid protein [Marinobacter sp. M3C]